jgi:hypothetical protein
MRLNAAAVFTFAYMRICSSVFTFFVVGSFPLLFFQPKIIARTFSTSFHSQFSALPLRQLTGDNKKQLISAEWKINKYLQSVHQIFNGKKVAENETTTHPATTYNSDRDSMEQIKDSTS